MSDALPLPPRPNLEQYKKLAKDLHRALNHDRDNAVRQWAQQLSETLLRLCGPDVTPELRADIVRETGRIDEHWRRFKKNAKPASHTLSTAQLFLARAHGFASWPRFAKHIESLQRRDSAVSTFEMAADAIVTGDLETLKRLLRENPSLIRKRSTRSHRSTLLHYVSANGIEDFRQKTPPNIVDVTKLLLAADADVNAESDAYAGRSTTLGLVATSYHPEKAGVQLELLRLLIEHGSLIEGPDTGSTVVGCLHNGRGEAAGFLADRGARVDLEGACGVGKLEVVRGYFNPDGTLKPPATEEQLHDGFAWACEFGKTEVVEFLLDHGISVGTSLRHHGQTGLHWAALGAHLDIVRLLLDRGAPVDAVDPEWGNTPLGWALYGWSEASTAKRTRFYGVVSLLIAKGAKIRPEWLESATVRQDSRMLSALGQSG